MSELQTSWYVLDTNLETGCIIFILEIQNRVSKARAGGVAKMIEQLSAYEKPWVSLPVLQRKEKPNILPQVKYEVAEFAFEGWLI